MTIKIKGLGLFEPIFVIGFNEYRSKLEKILIDNHNINKAEFFGVISLDTKKYGLLVIGINSQDTKTFKRFWTCGEINHYEKQAEKRNKIADSIKRFEEMIK